MSTRCSCTTTRSGTEVVPKLNPRWIERAIERAESSGDPGRVHDLAYLLRNIERGSDIWRRCKARLFRLIPPLHDRSLIANIFVHGDRDEIGRVVERVPFRRELGGTLGPQDSG